MKVLMRYLLVCFCLLSFVSGAAIASDVDTLVDWMTGSFSSEALAASDSTYFDIRLEMVEIWTDRTDARWLYVEQASASVLERPYRQRVYKITQEDDQFMSEVFALPDPLRFAGAFRGEAALSSITPDSLTVRTGCAVYLKRTAPTTFEGGTLEDQCESRLRGASYATSDVYIAADKIMSWDRGYDAEHKQVWGAVNGPYIFLRVPTEE
ncbi:MAG: hypothetical protein HKN21_08840 [Candidatus Eisenbacteria bacterium]|uniref:Chromophore lyase CpcT/CpeT n=1 Tax=Eiseniibacteriota bacterium TaxID=2212470 RepID=A0A7Y2E7W9_UNCEI|nr:hypothetical protein [Candidatus Eisenbacteria bacterium]